MRLYAEIGPTRIHKDMECAVRWLRTCEEMAHRHVGMRQIDLEDPENESILSDLNMQIVVWASSLIIADSTVPVGTAVTVDLRWSDSTGLEAVLVAMDPHQQPIRHCSRALHIDDRSIECRRTESEIEHVCQRVASYIGDVKLRTTRHELRSLSCLLSAKEAAESDGTASTCVICQDEIDEGNAIRLQRCSHVFHPECAEKWLLEVKGQCPVCKTPIILPTIATV
jgi:hypothetical protein